MKGLTISRHWSLSIPSENIQKPLILLCFEGIWKDNSDIRVKCEGIFLLETGTFAKYYHQQRDYEETEAAIRRFSS